MREWFCDASLHFPWDVNISGTEHKRKLKFSMQTYLTYINIKFEYFNDFR